MYPRRRVALAALTSPRLGELEAQRRTLRDAEERGGGTDALRCSLLPLAILQLPPAPEANP